jgi:PAS domain S-box-containing protein
MESSNDIQKSEPDGQTPPSSRDSEERYHTLFDLAPVAVYSCDAEGLIEKFNRRAAELWGREPNLGSPGERYCGSFRLIGQDGTVLPHEQCPAANVLNGKVPEVRDGEIIVERPDGSRISAVVNIRPLKNAHGEITGIINCFYDVTARRGVERKLGQSEVRYRRLFEAAHDGILILSTNTRRITDVNPFMLQLLDYPRDHFIGKELWEIGIFHDKEANQKAMQKLHENSSIRFENLPLQDRNGLRHPVEIVANIYQEGADSVIQCNIRDIGERVAFDRQRELLLANEQASRMEAEAANRSKDLFLATLSHEVRTPLNAILGWATILRGDTFNQDDFKEGMEVIERNCKIQAQLIEDVLDVSRIVSGKMRLQIVPCDLAAVINAALDVVSPAAAAKGIRFQSDFQVPAIYTSCDANRMQQVVWNLLANAVKFSAQGATVRVALTYQNGSARIEISDDGQGISAAFLPYVFDRFRQAEGSTRRTHGGLGLGLSIVRHLVELHGGTVGAASEGDGHGATFTVNLPRRSVDAAEREQKLVGRARHNVAALNPNFVRLDGLKVLVVDDEADARRLLFKVLAEAGASVTTVASVTEARQALAQAHTHVLLSDIAMPGQDGYDLIRQVRRAGHSPKELPAVALTAFAHKDDRLRALLAGFQVHVAKPIDPHELIAVIASLTGRTG